MHPSKVCKDRLIESGAHDNNQLAWSEACSQKWRQYN